MHLEVLDATYVCDSSCADNYLEIKHGTMLEQTGFRLFLISEIKPTKLFNIQTKGHKTNVGYL